MHAHHREVAYTRVEYCTRRTSSQTRIVGIIGRLNPLYPCVAQMCASDWVYVRERERAGVYVGRVQEVRCVPRYMLKEVLDMLKFSPCWIFTSCAGWTSPFLNSWVSKRIFLTKCFPIRKCMLDINVFLFGVSLLVINILFCKASFCHQKRLHNYYLRL